MLLKKQIRILFLCDEIEGTTGGTEQNIAFLLNNLPGWNYQVRLALLRKGNSFPNEFKSFNPLLLNLASFRNLPKVFRTILLIRKIIRKEKIDILQVYFRDSELLGALSFLKSPKCKLVIARRSLQYDDNRFVLHRSKVIKHVASHYLVNSLSIKKELINREKIDEKKIQVLYNPVNLPRAQNGLLNKFDKNISNLKEHHLIVGIVANIRPVKDFETFFKAAKIVKDELPKTKFVVVGSLDQKYWKRISYLINNTALKDCVLLLENVDNPFKVIPYFDVGVLTSTSEGLSNSLIEYAISAVPAVATDVGGNGEVVVDNDSGFLVPPSSPELVADKILELLKDKHKRLKMGLKAKDHILTKFNKDKIMSEYNSFYNSIVY